MKTINVANGPRNASAIILGCMRMPALAVREAADMILSGKCGVYSPALLECFADSLEDFKKLTEKNDQ